MIVQEGTLAGGAIQVLQPEDGADLASVMAWAADRPRRVTGLDTETTSLDTYARGFAIRLVQVSDATTAWVLRMDRPDHRAMVPDLIRRLPALVLHNATFDLLALDHEGLAPLEETLPKAFDTRTAGHLIDPRLPQEGGAGLDLKALAKVWVDEDAPDSQAALHARFHEEGWTRDTGWALIDAADPTFTYYAGLDPLLTVRLFEVLAPEVRRRGMGTLLDFEREVQAAVARMERRGILLDVPYLERLGPDLDRTREEYAGVAARWGVDNVESTRQVAAALQGMGETLTETTPSGETKVDKEVLLPLADLDHDWARLGVREPNPLADAVLRAKRASKWRTSYVDSTLALRDEGDRIHPRINPLQARTARMSIAKPPLQQLPSNDATVRSAFLADPGMAMVSVDYAQVELRILAALAQEPRMLEAIAQGEDLHTTAARLMFGDDFTKGQRKLAKNTGFGRVYGGGAKTLARQSGTDVATARKIIRLYDASFPGIKRYARALMDRAEYGRKEVVTPSGRVLPLDRSRLYAATNYVVQSTARDVLAQALLELEAAGLGDHLLLPIHDEVLAQAPVAEAADVAQAIAQTMTMPFQGTILQAEPEVYGASWGEGYRS